MPHPVLQTHFKNKQHHGRRDYAKKITEEKRRGRLRWRWL